MQRIMKKNSGGGSHLFIGLVISLFCTVLAAPVLASNLVLDLGVLPGGTSSIAHGVSADSSVVVGVATDASGYDHAFRWTQTTGMVDLGANTLANAVSADGSVVVGGQANVPIGNYGRAFRWTQATGMVDLGVLPGGKNSLAYGISADGSVVVGVATNASGNNKAFRWTQATGMVDLGTPGGVDASANGVSADGTVVVGQAQTSIPAGSQSHAVLWTVTGTTISILDLGTLGGLTSEAMGVSVLADGSLVVVGHSLDAVQPTPDDHAFRWTQATGMVDLGTLGGKNSAFYSVSADGSIAVGQAMPGSGGYEAMRWTQGTGMQTINQWLTANSVDSSTFSFSDASSVSSNGKAVVGQLTLPDSHAFLARLCYPLNPSYVIIGPAGGNLPICASTGSVNSAAWITPGSSSNGTFQFTVAANTSTNVRTGILTVDGQMFTVLQGTASQQAKIGTVRSGNWYVDLVGNYTWSGCGTDGCYSFGVAGDIPLMGDWDGSGLMRIGVFRNGWWYLDMNGNGTWDPSVDATVHFGTAGDIPVVGDWNGDGKTKIGVFRNGTWYLDYPGTRAWVGCGAPGIPSLDACIAFGAPGDVPVVGNWNGSADSKSKIGVFRNGMWYLDYPGASAWIGCGAPGIPSLDVCSSWGVTGDIPVVTK